MYRLKTSEVQPTIYTQVIKDAREEQALTIKQVADATCLSERQVQEIEEGGQISFYSTGVKITAAKKIAKYLKLSEEACFTYPPQAEVSILTAEIEAIQSGQLWQTIKTWFTKA